MSQRDPTALVVLKETPEESAPLNDEELQVLQVIKSKIGPNGMEMLTHENLLRFVRGYAFEKKNGGVQKWTTVACGEAEKTVAWRQKVDANTLLTRNLDRWAEFSSSWVTGIYGCDTKGHPILVERVEDFHLDKLLTFSIDELTINQARNMELLQHVKARVSAHTGKLIYKHCYILDIGAISTAFYKAKEQVKAIFHVAQYFYPETLYKMFVINSPFLFRAIWSMVSPFIHPITKEKIKILGGKDAYIPELLANGINLDQIPASVGGTYPYGAQVYLASFVDPSKATTTSSTPQQSLQSASAAAPQTHDF